MSRLPIKRSTARSQRKVSENPTIINPPQNIKNKFLPESDIIVHNILEKIFSFVISTAFKNEIENKINDSCFNFVQDTVNTYLTYYYLPFDNENFKNDDNTFFNTKNETLSEINSINKSNISNLKNEYPEMEQNLFLNNFIPGENSWDIMEEPPSNNFDRYASTMIPYKSIQNDKNEKFKPKGAEVLEEVSEDSEKNSKSDDEKNSNKNSNNNSKYSKENNNKINNNFMRTIFKKGGGEKKKKKLTDINQFSFHDLADDFDHYVEPEDIDYEMLRKEAEEKQKIVVEEKKESDKVKLYIEQKLREQEENIKKYMGKKITVDVEGNVVFIKSVKPEKLGKDFYLLKSSTRTYKENNKTIPNNSNKPKKKTSKIKLEENNNKIPEPEIIKNDNTENKTVKRKKSVIFNTNNSRAVSPKKDKFGKFLPKIDSYKYKYKNKFLSNTANPPEEKKSRIQNRIEEGPIIPSGSNFDIMNMEIGVSIKEDTRYKTGGKDFYLKYNKFSLDNYNKQLKKTLEANNIFLNTHKEIDINNDMNYNDTYGSYGFINQNFNQKTNKNYSTGKNYSTMSNFGLKTVSNNMSKNSNNSFSMNPLIKLKGSTSLMGSIDKLNLINEKEERLAKKTVNLFKKNHSTSTKENPEQFNEINKFTSQILTSKNWTSNNNRDILNTEPKIYNNRRVIGFQVHKEKELTSINFRSRSKNKNQISTPSIEGALFFK